MYNSADRIEQHGRNEVPCFGLLVILFLILGILPILPSQVTQVLRPAEIALCFVFPAPFFYQLSYSNKWLLLFMAYYVGVFFCHPITRTAFMAWASLELFAAFFLFIIARPWSKENIRMFIIVAAIASTFFAAIIFRYNPDFLHEKSYDGTKFFSTTINDNTTAFSIVPGTICSVLLFFFYSPKKNGGIIWQKVFFMICSGVCLFLLFCIGARSAFFSAVAGVVLVYLEWANQKKTMGERILARVTLIALLIAVFVIGTTVTAGTHSARLFDMENMSDGTGRDLLAEQAWEMIHKKPLFGGGFDYWVSENGDPLGTHNSFLTHMVQGGYIACFILVGFLITTVFELWKSRSLIPLAFIMEMLAHTFTESDLNYYAYVPLILSFLMVRYASFHRCKIKDLLVET